MTTNNPPIAAWAPSTALAKLASRHNNAPCVLTDGPAEFNDVALIRLSDYEGLQAECEKLRKDAEGTAQLLAECRTHLKPYHDSFMRAEAWEEGRYKPADALYRKIDAAMQRDNP